MSRNNPPTIRQEIDFLAFLARFGPFSVIAKNSEPSMTAKYVRLPNGEQVIFAERSYRDGIAVIENPTQQHIEWLQSAKLWDLWNADEAIRINPTIIDLHDAPSETQSP